eukprot:5440805-Pyramimonas_sp.AAC.1
MPWSLLATFIDGPKSTVNTIKEMMLSIAEALKLDYESKQKGTSGEGAGLGHKRGEEARPRTSHHQRQTIQRPK